MDQLRPLLVAAALLGCKPTYEDFDAMARAEEAAMKARAAERTEARAAQQTAQDHAGQAELKARAAEHDAAEARRKTERAVAVESFKASTTAERENLIRTHCAPLDCDMDQDADIISAAADDAERRKLASISAKMEATRAAARAVVATKAREDFTDALDTRLLDRHLNPTGVSATGAEKRTLTVNGWFCSRQFVYDFGRGVDGQLARAAGFRHLTCASSLETWSDDL
jgi:hypothetical protein